MSETRIIAEIRNLTAPLLKSPPLRPTPVQELVHRNQRRHHRRIFGISGVVAITLATVLLLTFLPANEDRSPIIRRSTNLASFVQKSVGVSDSVLEAVGRPASVAPLLAISGGSQLDSEESRPLSTWGLASARRAPISSGRYW
jgi:hypothetical protein